MVRFLIWMVVLLFIVTIYLLYLWKWKRPGSPFRAKMTALFAGFVLFPVIPLTFLTASLLTRSTHMLTLPGIEHALNTSLETIRVGAEMKGLSFLEDGRFTDQPSQSILAAESIWMTGRYTLADTVFRPVFEIRRPNAPLPVSWTPPFSAIRKAYISGKSSRPVQIAGHELFMVGKKRGNQVSLIVYPVPESLIQSRNEISRALNVYNTLSLMKFSILDRNVIWSLAIGFIFCLVLVAILAARQMSGRINHPVNQLVRGMEKAAENDLDHTIHVRAKDEFRFLAESFNTMIHDLKTSREKLIRAERIAAWQEVARRMSHEIKNSLTPVSISLRRLRTSLPPRTRSGMQDSLTAIEEELKHLENMAGTFSRFAHMPRPDIKSISLKESVDSVLQIIEPVRGAVQIITQISNEAENIQADPQLLKQLLNNLILNALDASPETGSIFITAEKDDPPFQIRLEIRDEGEGMDEKTVKKMAQPYFTTKKSGTGLGMAIVYKIVEDHGGRINIISSKDKGTTVQIRL